MSSRQRGDTFERADRDPISKMLKKKQKNQEAVHVSNMEASEQAFDKFFVRRGTLISREKQEKLREVTQ